MLKCHYKTKIIYITRCAFVIESHKSNSRNARILSEGKSDAYINVPVSGGSRGGQGGNAPPKIFLEF